MTTNKPIKTALLSVYHKDKIKPIVEKLSSLGIRLISTGGTKSFIENLGFEVTAVEDLTSYPSLFDGRVKTLHPAIMGGILFRRDSERDQKEANEHKIAPIDLVIVDLYPFEQTLKETTNEEEIIEKIDIGGISLIRAAAKNFHDVLIIPSESDYEFLLQLLENKQGISSLEDRKQMAKRAFEVSFQYDRAIYSYFCESPMFALPSSPIKPLRYGENPHQKAWFIGNFEKMFEKLQGQEISYNNLLDIDAGVHLIREFDEPTVAILKHNNACGLASDPNPLEAWKKALAGDPISAFGGIIVCNFPINTEIAKEIHSIFFEILIATDYSNEALEILSAKTKRIILRQKPWNTETYILRSCINGMLVQERDLHQTNIEHCNVVTKAQPSEQEIIDLLFANKIVKHTKSNAIVIVKNKQLIGSGIGQTSRVDATKHAIEKAKSFNFDLNGAVLASDAFFPFADSIEIASKEGIKAFIQPGGSIRDQETIDYCDKHNLSMIFTGFRHFKH